MNVKKLLFAITFLSIFLVSNLFADNYYWVGNSGNWNNPTHWSNVSGGIGGIGVPTSNDNVFIDNNSFTITNAVININADIDVNNLSILENSADFTITSVPNININIYNNLEVKAIFSNTIKANIHFKNSQNTNSTLYFGWFKWLSDFYFEGNGSYTLTSPLQAHGNKVSLVKGELNLNGFDVLCNTFSSVTNQKRKLISKNSSILAYNKWETNTSKFNYDFSNTKIYVISSDKNAVNKGGDNYFIKQSKSPNNKTISNQTVSNDTVSCGNTCDGSIIVNFTNSCPNATVDWLPSSGVDLYTGECLACPISGANASDTISNLCPGIYTAVITSPCDGDVKAPQGEVKGHPSIVPIVQTVNQTSCKDSCDGSINVVVTGAPYAVFSYQWIPGSAADTNNSMSNLCAGTYAIEVQDGFGCIDTFTYNLPEPAAVNPNVAVTNVQCFGQCNGTATASPTGGTGAGTYIYDWNSGAFTTPGITGLCIGSVDSIHVTDANGCVGDTTITITGPNQIQLDTVLTHVSCGGLCDGSITTTVLSGGVGPFTHNWSTGVVFVGNVSSISSLCFGNYSDSIVDANGCDTVINFIITEPTPLITSTNTNNVTCFNACNGTATTTPSGGTSPYFYNWSSIPAGGVSGGQGTDSIFSLCPAQYIVDVTDSKGCTVADTVSITEPLLLIANPDSSNTSCSGVCDGSVTAVPTGGTTPYSYSWTGPGGPYPGQTVNSLCPGTYVVTVTDSNSCTTIDSVSITSPPLLVLTMSSTDMSCNAVCDGTAGVVVSGGTTPYNYTWVSTPAGQVGTGQGTPNITGLCAGTYTVTIVDSAGCTTNNNTVVNEPSPVLANLTTTNVSCFGSCNGTATVTPTGGNPPFQVDWDGAGPIPVVGSNTITSLCAGAHTAIVIDNNNCQNTINFNITEPTLLTTTTTGTDLTCNGGCNGTATTSPTGGSTIVAGVYSYSWAGSGAPFPNTPSISNLCAGTYIVTITDDSNCTVIDSIVINEPVALNPNAQSTNVTCNGANDGTAIALPIGGTPPYASITWTTIGGTPVIPAGNPVNNLSAGQYVVTVVDAVGCTGLDTVTITEPATLVIHAEPVDASCGTICDGSITVLTITGGTPGYSFSWNDPSSQTTQTATNLCAGIYTVIVTDTNGCTATDLDTVVNLVTIIVNANAVNNGCNTICDGMAVATPGGGQSPYTFTWSAGNPGAALGDTTFNLCQGWVFVTVTDFNGCATQDSVLVPAAPPVFQLNSSSTNVTCNGLCDGTATVAPSGGITPYSTIQWSTGATGNTITGLCAGSYWVTGTDSVGCQITDTIVITQPDTITANPTIVNVNCNGSNTGSVCLSPSGGTPSYIYLWGGGLGTSSCINNQPAGTYTVTITDTNNCPKNLSYTIAEPTNFSSNPISTNVTCFGLNDGMASVLLAGGTPPYSCSWNTGATTDTINNLAPGAYSVICTDSNGCTASQNITITEPNQLLANVTGTSIACGGTPCTGTAQSNPTGGTPSYSYQWTTNAGNYATTDSINNLCQDTFNVVVTDTNGCTANGTYIVTTPTILAVTLDSTNITCNNANDGTATAIVTGGVPPYTYSWVGGCLTSPDTNAVVTGLCAGTYTVTVTDSFGCFFIGSVNIINPPAISDNSVVTPANCGACDGVIAVFPSGGTPFYTHSWSNGATTSTITNLCAGFYTDTIEDFNNCVSTFTLTISNPSGPSGVTSTINDATCYGACDGAVNVIPIGGSSPYTYSWSGPNAPYLTDSTLTGLCASTLNLTVTDAGGCIYSTNIVVGQADSIKANSSFTNATCNGSCDGTASVSPSGGTAPYTFLWSDGSTGSSVSGLCIGATSVTITDFRGCTKVINFNITSPNTLAVTSTTTNTSCNTICDGTATVTPTGGTPNYTYQWNDPSSQTTQTSSNLCAGTYIVSVADLNGCSAKDTVVITEPSLISANVTTTLATCGGADGTATASPTGGTSPYTYLWCNGVTTPNVNGLPAGTCNLQITDSNNCVQTFPIAISNTGGPTISTTSTNASCNGTCDGTAGVSVTNGTPNYTFLWSNSSTTNNVTGLCAGTYTIQVTDGNNCSTTSPVTITDNAIISATVSVTSTSCNGSCDGSALVTPSGGTPPYAYSWSTGHTINAVGGLCAGNYTVTITDASNCSVVKNVTIPEPNILTVNVTGTNANCNGGNDGTATATPSGGTTPYSYLWSTNATTPSIVGLIAGTYVVTITDANGCSTNDSITINEGSTIISTISTTNATCGLCNGTATSAVPTGGAGGPYTYLWLPSGQTTNSASNLCPGAYTLDISDNVGCTQTFNVLISNPTGPSISTFSDSVSCFGSCNGVAWTVINSGNSPFTYQWNDPALTANDTASSLCAGFYSVIVKDSVGCITTDSTTVLSPQQILANITSTAPSCPGVCDATATSSPTGGVGTLSYSWSNGATTSTITGLCAGTYILTITDGKGCSIVDSVIITDPTPINITISSTSPTCNGDCDATALATASGGTPSYSYSWNTSPSQPNSLATSLCAGTYIVTVTDNNSCIDTASVNVINPLILSTSTVKTDATCNGSCDGTATTTPAGGVGPYTYSWNNGQTTNPATNLCAGTYIVTVIDANNCSINDTITISEPAIINDSTVVSGPTCGLCDGSATSTPTGGTGPFDFTWTDPLGSNLSLPFTTPNQASSTVVGLCAGTVNLQITDLGTGCSYTYTIIVNSSTGPNIALTSTGETCVSACDGTATATPSGGNPPYSYSWSPTSPTDTNQTATNLCANFYTVTVTDSIGCVASDTVTIGTSGLNLNITNVIPETCFGSCDGSATVNASAGTTPFSYAWTPTNPTIITPIASNLCVGLYTATVTDAALCKDSLTTNITGPSILTVSATVNSNISCNAVCDGAVIASPLGGTTNYTYSWDDPLNQTTQIATNLCAGTYHVTITDANGCTATDSVILTEPTPIVANENLVLPACNVCNGSITLNPTGGIGPFTFLWTATTNVSGAVTSSINNLCAGSYSVDITDVGTGCTSTFNFALSNSNAPIPNTTVTNVSCNGICDGQILATPTGGTPPYVITWNSGTGNPNTNLCAGTYNVNVTDSLGCIGIENDTITEPALLQLSLTSGNLNCNGSNDGWIMAHPIGGTSPYTYGWSPSTQTTDSIINLSAGQQIITVTDTNGCTAIDSLTITEPTVISTSSTKTDASCSSICDGSATENASGGTGTLTYQWNGDITPNQTSTAIGLCYGQTTVLITDQNGCNVTDTINIGATDTVLANAGTDTTICQGSSTLLTGIATGTITNVEWFELPAMTSIGTSDTVTVSPPGVATTCYVYKVTGACDDYDTVCVTTIAAPVANAGTDISIFENNTTTLNGTGGGSYVWTPGSTLNDSTIANPTASPIATTTYVVTVTSATGCTATDSVTVTVLPTIKFPDGITPNGDGYNDLWVIDFIEEYPNNVVEIYNRWGELLFHEDGYKQDWDGTYNGKELPIGTYYYVIDLKSDLVAPFTGPITILR